ncbi:AAA family ATPase [Treponema sp.]|uniref:AAA family ATPase n=1 Tax=Treponema sp. TaxID=166 RepID=UPI003FA32E4E
MNEKSQKSFIHRLKNDFFSGIEKGYNSFFYHGIGIGDLFLYDYYHGILSIKETFKHIYLDNCVQSGQTDNGLTHGLADFYIYARGEAVLECWEKQGDNYIDISSEFFTPKQESDDSDGIPSSSQRDANRNDSRSKQVTAEATQQLNESNQRNKNNWSFLIERINTQGKKAGIFIEDIQWLINLYAANRDAGLVYIKIIQELLKNKSVYLAFSVPKLDLLKDYDFDFDGKNTVFVGHPTVPEVKLAYLRQFLRQTDLDEIPVNTLAELNKIAAGIVASKKDLRSAMRVFYAITGNRGNYEIKYDDFKKTSEKEVAEDISIDDVILEDSIKNTILSAVDTFLKGDEDAKKGLVFSGPPGTGKTLIAKAIARQKDCYFMAPSLSDLKGEYVGQTSGKVRRIFDEARASQPTILFIDEADTIFPSRDLAGSTSDSYNLDMVNQFLVEIDGAKTGKQKIFVIAATNRVATLDNAVRSRLGLDIPFPLPDKDQRKRIFDNKLKKDKITFADKDFAEEIAVKTDNMSGRDIENFVKTLREVSRNEYRLELSSHSEDTLRELFFKVLKKREKSLIADLKNKKIGIEITHPSALNTVAGWISIIGYDNIKNKIDRLVMWMKYSADEKQTAKKFNVEPVKGMLLYGPPGNAKSMLAMAAAKEHNLYFVKVLSKDFASINPDLTLKNLQIIFSEILKLSKMCKDVNGILLFFDEYDALASKLQLSTTVRGTLLDYIADNEKKGLRDLNGNILFMAATNYIELLDEALIRKGRIDEHCFMDNPSRGNAIEMLTLFSQKGMLSYADDTLIEKIYERLCAQKKQDERKKLQDNPAELQKLLTGAAIESKESMESIECILEKRARPSGADIENAVKNLSAEAFYSKSLSENQLEITEDIVEAVFPKQNGV